MTPYRDLIWHLGRFSVACSPQRVGAMLHSVNAGIIQIFWRLCSGFTVFLCVLVLFDKVNDPNFLKSAFWSTFMLTSITLQKI